MPRSRKAFFTYLLLGLAVLAAGCFDYNLELTLEPGGNGLMRVTLDVPSRLGAGETGRRLDTIVYPPPDRQLESLGRRVRLSEVTRFQWLDVLALRRVKISVKRISGGIFGLTDRTYQVSLRLNSWEGDLPDRDVLPGTELETKAPKPQPRDPAQERARQLLAGGLGGHHISVTLNLPGRVIRAWPLVVGSEQVKPRIQGGRVSWRVPLSTLMAQNLRHNLVFRCRFKGRLAFRGPYQTEAFSRYPTKRDDQEEARAEKARREAEAAARRAAQEAGAESGE